MPIHRARDHPRIRGEHALDEADTAVSAGSSPHTRGAPADDDVDAEGRGIIPAYAGSTITGLPDCNHEAGSSPHTRGARQIGAQSLGRGGIIPAYAGSTRLIRRVVSAPRDHPRIRGEHALIRRDVQTGQGSSPHTRGARQFAVVQGAGSRIIPAYAGSTAPRWASPRARPDHPRIRGEHPTDIDGRSQQSGSSPHTRGAQRHLGIHGDGPGIIPAYAGSTLGVSLSGS